MRRIQFSDDEGVLGEVRVTDTALDPDPGVADIVDRWERFGDTTPSGFLEHYTAWSNGYLRSSSVEG